MGAPAARDARTERQLVTNLGQTLNRTSNNQLANHCERNQCNGTLLSPALLRRPSWRYSQARQSGPTALLLLR
jgi:hypothetical protein